jgi:hypothetical protein
LTFFQQLTDNFQTAVMMELANVACFEPPLAILLEKVFLCLAGQLIVALRYTFTAHHNLSLRVWFVGDTIVALLPVDQPDVACGGRGARSAEIHVPFCNKQQSENSNLENFSQFSLTIHDSSARRRLCQSITCRHVDA